MTPDLEPTADLMEQMADGIDDLLNGGGRGPGGNGFVLLVFSRDALEGTRTNYIGNVDRADMLSALKEILARLEGRTPDAPRTRQ